MNPSFTTLFERSRYSSRAKPGILDPEGQEQRERFAVGMVAFALDHDDWFRRRFLKAICGLDGEPAVEKWTILVEPENWGDLVLKNEALSEFIVVEFKVDSDLQLHQNPEHKEFWSEAASGATNGYGWEIPQHAQGFKTLRYITVEKALSWRKAARSPARLMCIPRTWRDMAGEAPDKDSHLEAQVYDCMGRFGVASLGSRRLSNMKKTNDVMDAITILAGVLESHGGRFQAQFIDAQADYFGVKLNRKQFPKLAQLVPTTEETVGWIGYENEPRRLQFWFYFDRGNPSFATAAESVKRLLLDAGFTQDRISFAMEGKHFFVYALPDDDYAGDGEWLEKVFSALNC